MKKGAGKAKGSAFEREIAKLLSLWISNGEHDDWLWRTSNSGGRATVRQKKNLNSSNQDGDISSTSPESHWLTESLFIELKHYKSLNLFPLFTRSNCEISGWWKKAREQANGKEPLLIVKQNNKPILCFVSHDLATPLISNLAVSPSLSIYLTPTEQITCFLLNELSMCDPLKFKEMITRKGTA